MVADDLDLEIYFSVAVGVALQQSEADLVHEMQLAGLVVEGLPLDEDEVLIAREKRIGVDVSRRARSLKTPSVDAAAIGLSVMMQPTCSMAERATTV
jgi:2-hydroxychromene-2-carboxylate isomerase